MRVAALGHDRQFGAGLVGPHAEAEEAEAEAVADGFHLFEVAAGFGAGVVEGGERGARQFELAGGFEADGAVGAGERDDLSVLEDRAPAIFGQAHQQVADSAGLVPRGRAVVGEAIDEFLVLGADAPVGFRFLAPAEHRQQVVAALDQGAVAKVGARGHDAPVSANPRPPPYTGLGRPGRRFRRAGCGGRGRPRWRRRQGCGRARRG